MGVHCVDYVIIEVFYVSPRSDSLGSSSLGFVVVHKSWDRRPVHSTALARVEEAGGLGRLPYHVESS